MKETVIILTPGFPKDEDDSTCVPPQQVFVKALHRQFPQLDIVIVSLQYPYEQKEYRWYDIPVIAFGGRNKGGFQRRWLWHKARRRLEQLHREKRISAILSFWCGECALIGGRFARKHYLPYFIWILGQDARPGNSYVRKIKPRAGELIALSDFIRHEFEKNYAIRPATVIPPGIDRSLFEPMPRIKDIDLLAAGSLIPLKQYQLFIDTVATVIKIYPSAKAVLIGDGQEKEKLQQRIQELELAESITLVGELPHEEVLRYMQRAKLLLHPSSYEGFGMVCMEALYAGAMVISFCKPMKEEIKNWHIVTGRKEMLTRSLELLAIDKPGERVLYHAIEDTVEKMYGLLSV